MEIWVRLKTTRHPSSAFNRYPIESLKAKTMKGEDMACDSPDEKKSGVKEKNVCKVEIKGRSPEMEIVTSERKVMPDVHPGIFCDGCYVRPSLRLSCFQH